MYSYVKYYHQTEELLVSTHAFVGLNGNLYVVKINLKEGTFYIRNQNTKKIVRRGKKPVKNRNVLLRNAKKALMKCGVEFKIRDVLPSDKQKKQINTMIKNNTKASK